MSYVPELSSFANLEVKVPFNVDSSRVGPKEWTILAKLLHENRAKYDAFLVRAFFCPHRPRRPLVVGKASRHEGVAHSPQAQVCSLKSEAVGSYLWL